MSKLLLQQAWIYLPQGHFRWGALALSDGRIEAVLDQEEANIITLAGGVDSIDLDGAYVLPGFVDTHIHLTSLAMKKLRCDLSGARSAEEACEMLTVWAANSDAPAIMGVEFDESQWEQPVFPTRSMLDEIDATRPVLARRICGHVGVVNSVMMETVPRFPGLVDEDSGVIREQALWSVGRVFDPSPDELPGAMEQAIRGLHRLGITAVHDIVEPGRLINYMTGVLRSAVPLRIDMLIHTLPKNFKKFERACRNFHPGIMKPGTYPDYLRVAGVKCFLDGSLGGETAALNAPYEGGGERGVLLMSESDLRATARASHDGGFACAMHAIGDRAIDQALGVIAEFPGAECFRIEHCELVGPEQLRRLEKTPVLLSLQPNFARNWGMVGGLYQQRLGERYRRCNRFRTLEESGVEYVFGSDGMPPGPIFGIASAVEHPIESERLSRAEAIDRYTRRPSATGFHKRKAGRLEAGYLADLVVLDRNPLEADLDRVQVRHTFVGGKHVFVKPAEVAE